MSRNIVEVDPKRFPWLDLNRYTFCMATEQAGIVYLSGQTASEFERAAGRVVCKETCWNRPGWLREIGGGVGGGGMSFDNVVQTVDYIDPTALPQYRETGEIRRDTCGAHQWPRPASASSGCCAQTRFWKSAPWPSPARRR